MFDEELRADMESIGYVFFEDGSFGVPFGVDVPSLFVEVDVTDNNPLYPKFNVSKFPWNETPSYVQDIVYSGMDSWYSEKPEIPFVLLSVSSNKIYVWVGVNLFLGAQYNPNTLVYSDIIRIASNSKYLADYNLISKCYYAVYDYSGDNFVINTPWSVRASEPWGTKGQCTQYSSNILTARDTYLYGGNLARPLMSSVTLPLTDNYNCTVDQNPYGFNAEIKLDLSADVTNYFTAFTPPTLEQLEQETQKGIWETLKSIPDTIAEKFKGLFIPEEGYFDTYIQEYQDYFSERFGLLYEIPDSIMNIFRQLIEFNPAEEGYYIDFPEVVMPVLENGVWRDVVLIEETKVTFDFLDEGPIATLYSMYRAALWLLFIFLLINLIIRKSDKVFGGGSG